jgi:hypothetical protein
MAAGVALSTLQWCYPHSTTGTPVNSGSVNQGAPVRLLGFWAPCRPIPWGEYRCLPFQAQIARRILPRVATCRVPVVRPALRRAGGPVPEDSSRVAAVPGPSGNGRDRPPRPRLYLRALLARYPHHRGAAGLTLRDPKRGGRSADCGIPGAGAGADCSPWRRRRQEEVAELARAAAPGWRSRATWAGARG